MAVELSVSTLAKRSTNFVCSKHSFAAWGSCHVLQHSTMVNMNSLRLKIDTCISRISSGRSDADVLSENCAFPGIGTIWKIHAELCCDKR